MRIGLGMRERWRECSGQVGVTLARNPGREEGKSGMLRPWLAPEKEGSSMDQSRGSGRG